MPLYNQTVIIGAGPAGLTAAYEIVRQGATPPLIIEKADKVGGIARTETYKGYRFDIGGHRFYTKVSEVEQIWHEVLQEEFIKVPRLSRIYYQGKFFSYPLEPYNALANLGIKNSLSILMSYLKAKIKPHPEEENFEQWVSNRFGQKLYEIFFKTYTEKVWGIPCTQIRADWAAQRIKGMSLRKAILNAFFSMNETKSLIKEFYYPVLGPGMMWERIQEKLADQGSFTYLNSTVEKIYHQNYRVTKVTIKKKQDTIDAIADNFIASMPVTQLISCLYPTPPQHVLEAARNLKYRDFLIVALIIDQANLFPDNWIYIHSPEFQVGRIQNFKNWSAAMVPSPEKTCLGMEYFCNHDSHLWNSSDEKLIELAGQELVALNLVDTLDKIKDGTVIRQFKAYPVYDDKYRQHLQTIKHYLQQFENLQTIGRNGMHRYNNQDHSMLTGLLAAKNILGEEHDLWEVNTERSYYEEFTKKGKLDTTP